jgi:fructokinase
MILCHGEMVIDFIPTEAREGSLAYRPAVGGSPGNVAVTIARLGSPAGFAGGVSTDFFGDAITKTLTDNGVSTAYLTRTERPSMLAFVNLEGEEPRYAFYDAEAANRFWRLDEMPPLGADVKALHFGSLSLSRLPAAEDFAALMRREADRRIISFDPNVRAGLIDDERAYRALLDEFFHRAHIIKPSGADLAWIAPGADLEKLARDWLSAEARLALLTRGGAGATLYGRSGTVSRPAVPVEVADTVGAGDAIMGGLLAELSARDLLDRDKLGRLDEGTLAELLDFALAVAAVTCSRVGADPPTRGELTPCLEGAGG